MRGRRLRRFCVLAAAALMAGAFANVVVAWGCVLWAPWPEGRRESVDSPRWNGRVASTWPEKPAAAEEYRTALLVSSSAHWTRRKLGEGAVAGCVEDRVAAGWPLQTMQRRLLTYWLDGEGESGLAYEAPSSGYISKPRWVPVVDGNWERHLLPGVPVFPQFVIGAAFNSGFIALAFHCVGTIRRRSRTRTGHCPTCGYDLVGLPAGTTCPECGAASAARSSLALRAR